MSEFFKNGRTPKVRNMGGTPLNRVGEDSYADAFNEYAWYQANPDKTASVKAQLYTNGDSNIPSHADPRAFAQIYGYMPGHMASEPALEPEPEPRPIHNPVAARRAHRKALRRNADQNQGGGNFTPRHRAQGGQMNRNKRSTPQGMGLAHRAYNATNQWIEDDLNPALNTLSQVPDVFMDGFEHGADRAAMHSYGGKVYRSRGYVPDDLANDFREAYGAVSGYEPPAVRNGFDRAYGDSEGLPSWDVVSDHPLGYLHNVAQNVGYATDTFLAGKTGAAVGAGLSLPLAAKFPPAPIIGGLVGGALASSYQDTKKGYGKSYIDYAERAGARDADSIMTQRNNVDLRTSVDREHSFTFFDNAAESFGQGALQETVDNQKKNGPFGRR